MDKELRARCDEKHTQALIAIAKFNGISQAEALRQLVRDKAKEYGVWPSVEEGLKHRRQAQAQAEEAR